MAPAERHHCDECGKTYATVGHLNRHKRVHTGERPYKCHQCHKSFMRKDHLDDHSFSHTAQRPFPCSQCDMKFYTKQKLKRHEVLHDRPKPYVCEDCNEAFVKKNQLARHRIQHTGKQPFPCPEPNCEKAFAVPSALRRHQEHRHSLSTYLCIEPGCMSDPFTKFSQLQRHLKLHRPKQPHTCDRCGKRFSSASSLKKHMPTHELPVADRMIYKCRFPGCSSAYTSSGNLGTHVRSQHLNREAFVCELCKARFSIKSSYERHLRNLHGADGKEQKLNLNCRICNNGVPSRAALRRHLRVQHKISASHNEETSHTELGDPILGHEEEKAEDVVTACPKPVGMCAISAADCDENHGDDLLRLKEMTNGRRAAISIHATSKRKRECKANMKDQNTEESRGSGTAENGIDFEDQQESKRQRFTALLDPHGLAADGSVPALLPLNSDNSPDLMDRHRAPVIFA